MAGLCSATAGIAGVFIALTSTLAPSQIEAWIGVVFAVVIIGGLGATRWVRSPAGMLIGALRGGDHGRRQSRLGAAGGVLHPDRAAPLEAQMARDLMTSKSLCGAIAVALVALPYIGAADFYLSYLYIIFFWIALATSWGILSGYAGYWSFGHAAFFGAGCTPRPALAAKVGLPYLLTIPLAAGVAALLALVVGLVVFRSSRCAASSLRC